MTIFSIGFFSIFCLDGSKSNVGLIFTFFGDFDSNVFIEVTCFILLSIFLGQIVERSVSKRNFCKNAASAAEMKFRRTLVRDHIFF